MASKEFIDKFNKLRESIVEVSNSFCEFYLSPELKLADVDVNLMKILGSLADAVAYANKELKILERGNNGQENA